VKQPTQFEIPEQLRDAADQAVGQARKAFEQFLDATHKAVAQVEGSAKTMGDNAADARRRAIDYAEENIAASFEAAQKLAQARTLEEVLKIQQDYMEKRVAAAMAQSQQIGGIVSRAASAAMDKARK
jgi:phasin